MPNKLQQWVEYVLGLLLSFVWRKEKPKLQKIAGKKMLPVEVLSLAADIIPHVVDGLKNGHSPADIWETVKKNFAAEALAAAEMALNVALPGAGSILGLIVWMHANSKPMTQEETNAWMDRFGIGAES